MTKRKGRAKGKKNLRYNQEGNIVNQYGVVITPQEKKALESAVNSANRKRRNMLKMEATLPRKVGGIDTGQTVGSLQLMGKESDFILGKRTKSIQRFQTRKQFDQYMNTLEKVNKRDYVTERVRAYKRNHMQALENVFGDDAKDIKMKIRMMKPADYMKMVQSDEMLEIGYIYDAQQAQGKLNQIRASMGMKLKDY